MDSIDHLAKFSDCGEAAKQRMELWRRTRLDGGLNCSMLIAKEEVDPTNSPTLSLIEGIQQFLLCRHPCHADSGFGNHERLAYTRL